MVGALETSKRNSSWSYLISDRMFADDVAARRRQNLATTTGKFNWNATADYVNNL